MLALLFIVVSLCCLAPVLVALALAAGSVAGFLAILGEPVFWLFAVLALVLIALAFFARRQPPRQ